MTMKKLYTCDICNFEIEDLPKSYGLHFSDLENFTLGGYGSTDNKHICYRCAKQLCSHFNNEEIKKQLGV